MDVAIGKAAQVGEHDADAPASQPSIALLGRKSRVDPGARVQAQEAVGPGDTKTAR
jgi:hypothetical protein